MYINIIYPISGEVSITKATAIYNQATRCQMIVKKNFKKANSKRHREQRGIDR
jgi:hypothetical protein